MLHERRLELMNYRLAMADEKLNSAKILLEYKSYKDSISRSYYAMFTAVRAILALDGVDFKFFPIPIKHQTFNFKLKKPCHLRDRAFWKLAERVGFEPTVRCRITSFQD